MNFLDINRQSILFSISLSWLCLCACTTPKESSERPPNILFFIADDMYPEMFNCLPQGAGKNLTPNIDKLAQEGTLMFNQYVASPVCTPSRYNCLSGRYASRATNDSFVKMTEREEGQTVIQWNSFLTAKDKILPHYLKEAGYVTGMVGKNHVIEAKGLQRFEDFNADPEEPEINEKIKDNYRKAVDAVLGAGFDYAGGIYHNNPNFVGVARLAVQNLDWTTEAGVNFIDQHHDKPFFLYFATTVPHGPTSADRSWNADPRITANGILDEAPRGMPARSTIPARLEEAGFGGKGKENILWLDDALGALISKLEQHKILDNTIIFFFNDHGQHAKGTLYQGGALNPSIVWQTGGFLCGNTSQVKISNVDFAPTILDLAGIDFQRDAFDGRSFVEVLNETKSAPRKSLYFELGYGRAVIMGDYKYYAIRYPEYARSWSAEKRAEVLDRYNDGRRFRNMQIVNMDPARPFSHLMTIPGGGQAENKSYGVKPGYFDRDQLYNLKDDPGEQVNLANDPEYAGKLEEMKVELKKYLDELPGKFEL